MQIWEGGSWKCDDLGGIGFLITNQYGVCLCVLDFAENIHNALSTEIETVLKATKFFMDTFLGEQMQIFSDSASLIKVIHFRPDQSK